MNYEVIKLTRAKECGGCWECLRLDFFPEVCTSRTFSKNLINTAISDLLFVMVCNTESSSTHLRRHCVVGISVRSLAFEQQSSSLQRRCPVHSVAYSRLVLTLDTR